MRKKATNLTLSDEIRTRAHAVMAARGFSSFSAYVEQLIREEYDRRQSTAAAPINSAPSPAFQAIFEAAAMCVSKGIPVQPEVMVPLVGYARELELQVEIIHRVAAEVKAAKGVKFDYLVGTMIEVPRGCITADEIAKHAQFFSFGTNDLTQTTLGVSRDDMGSFLNSYQENDIYPKNPFASLDTSGVGQLMEIAVAKGRSTKKNIKLGICGEHGGDPDSVTFCHKLGLAYVSCSPYRVPVARLAAAQAAILDGSSPKPVAKKAAKKKAKK